MSQTSWWRSGVVYQIYPRSWADSNGDGIGDLPGIISRLDHLSWLGVDAIWLNPITPSPNHDWGYDVSDYTEVHPALGTLHDLEMLVKEAGDRGIAVVLDLVQKHTSDQHTWFRQSRESRASSRRDWYVWRPPGSDGKPPNNWVRAIGDGPAWTYDDGSGEYYMHSFLPQQPDLNWWNEEVRDAFDDIIRFWFERGISGFRIDVVHALIHDPELRENPPVSEDDHPQVRRFGQRQVFNMNQPEVHDIIRRWRRIADGYGDRVLIGETYLFDLADVAKYYGENGEELHLAFNFPFVFADFEATELAGIVESALGAFPRSASAAWAASNHDAGRFATRWCSNDPRRARLALMLLLTLPGVVFLYYGDEIGLPEVDVPRDQLLDPAGRARWPERGRDPGRTPMQWTRGPGAGFTSAPSDAWLPIGDSESCNVEDQRGDPDSPLELTRQLISLRRTNDDLAHGDYEPITIDRGLWAYRRGSDTEVWLNLSDEPRRVDTGDRRVIASVDRSPSAIVAPDALELAAWDGAVVEKLGGMS